MAETFQLEIVTPERRLVAEEVEEVRAPTPQGEFGVLPHHTRLMTILGVGEVAYRVGEEWHRLAVASGFAQVEFDRVTILAQTAEMAEEIDIPRAEAARKRAEERLAEPGPDTDVDRARVALQRALARLRVAGRAGDGEGAALQGGAGSGGS